MVYAVVENEDNVPTRLIAAALDGFELEFDVVGEDGEEHEVKVRLGAGEGASAARAVVRFRVTGGFDAPANLARLYDAQGNVVGYELPDGRAVRLVVGLEVAVDRAESGYEYLTDTAAMAAVGFEGLEYDETVFEEAVGHAS